MSKINLLVLDDELDKVKPFIDELKLNDEAGVIGNVYYKDTFPSTLETFDISEFIDLSEDEKVDVILIDNDLKKSYTGTLLGAWLLLRNRLIPRISFTTLKYKDAEVDFDGSIEKNNILYHPKEVIQKIVDTIHKFQVEDWLTKNYSEYAKLYGNLCSKKLANGLSKEEITTLELIKSILDSLDKQLDRKLEESIELKFRMAEKKYDKLESWEKKINELDEQFNEVLEQLKNCEG